MAKGKKLAAGGRGRKTGGSAGPGRPRKAKAAPEAKNCIHPEAQSLVSTFSSDRPIQDPRSDRLAYAPFARQLADALASADLKEGLVIGLCGPWGCGKTTVINFVLDYLQNDHPSDGHRLPVIFNPWWFSNEDDLLRAFLVQMSSALPRSPEMKKRVKNAIGNLLEVASCAPGGWTGGLKVISGALKKEQSIPSLKKEISDYLLKNDLRLLVVIDDLDRLAPNEIWQVFRIVKAVCDFNNVTYLLAFDKAVVAEALTKVLGVPGGAYLEKVVQVPVDIPLPDQANVGAMLFEHLDMLISRTPEDLFEKDRWANLYLECIAHVVSMPRHVVRLVNALRLSYPTVQQEVNAVDFIGMEVVRIFFPSVYEAIRAQPGAFIHDSRGRFGRQGDRDDLEAFYTRMFARVGERQRKVVEKLVTLLFPKVDSILKKYTHGAGYMEEWRRAFRVCSAEVFPAYFRLAVPDGGVSRAELMSLLEIAGDRARFSRAMRELAKTRRPDGQSQIRPLLERLGDFAEKEIRERDIGSIVGSFCDVGDEVISADDVTGRTFEIPNELLVWWVIKKLLGRLDLASRVTLLNEQMSTGGALRTIVLLLKGLGSEHEDGNRASSMPPESKLVDSQSLEELRKMVVERLKKAGLEDLLPRPGANAGEGRDEHRTNDSD